MTALLSDHCVVGSFVLLIVGTLTMFAVRFWIHGLIFIYDFIPYSSPHKKTRKVTTKNVNTQVKREIICKKDRFDIYRSLSFSTHSSLLSCEMLNDRMIKC